MPTPVPYVDLSDPQSLNQYAYIRNNPKARFDADGHAGNCNWWCRTRQRFHNSRVGLGFRTDAEVKSLVQQVRDLKEGEGWVWHNSTTGQTFAYEKEQIDKMSDREVVQAYDEAHPLFSQESDPSQALANAPIMTTFGWSGTKPYRDAAKQLEQAGTHETLGGKVPTRAEATRMIEESGGKVIRQDAAHGAESVSTHNYPHINYETASGAKATVRVTD